MTDTKRIGDDTVLPRLQEIWELLSRASNLGFSLSLTPEKAKELAALLEEANLVKIPRRTP